MSARFVLIMAAIIVPSLASAQTPGTAPLAQTNPFVGSGSGRPTNRAPEDQGAPRAVEPGPAQSTPAMPNSGHERPQNRNTSPTPWPAATRT